jgi:Spermine/spermidine synthase domain
MNTLFSCTVFLSAFLLFWVELFFAKLLLPSFGGGAHIWTTCLAAFQVLMLVGYGYAWAVTKLSFARQAAIQVILMIFAIATLPVNLRIWQLTDIPSLQIGLTLMASIGLPMILLSTTSSLLQSWYSKAVRQDPYFLYAISNAGSLLALIVYPAFLEPRLTIVQQSSLWSGLFAISAILTATSLFKSYPKVQLAQAADAATHHPELDQPPIQLPRFTPWAMVQCFLFAFVPSTLLSGVTSYITSEIAPNPVVWSLFLGLYLATLILTFLPSPFLTPRNIGNPLLLFITGFLALDLYSLARFDRDALLGNIVIFMLLCWFYHSRLVRLKPASEQLGQFYFVMVLGGACGALFNAILAPLIFVRMTEYHVALALASPLLFSVAGIERLRWMPKHLLRLIQRYARPGVILLSLALTLIYAFPAMAKLDDFKTERFARSFYSSYIIGNNDRSRFLIHGRTLHGRESLALNDRTPGSYYHPGGPVSNVFDVMPENAAIAAVGLGVGEVAAYAKPQQDWTFLEIDPLVVDIAQNNFHHLKNMPRPPKIIVGDGRLKLQDSQQTYDLIILDAFNSDAIPTHLLTQEAIRDVFLPHLKPNGVILYNITNTFVDLEPILQQLAQAVNVPALTRFVRESKPGFRQTPNQWVVLTQNPQILDSLKSNEWHNLKPGKALWTDNFSSIRAAMKRR